MLGRKTYTQEELDHAKASVAQQLGAYDALAVVAAGTPELAAFEPRFFNNMALVLDRLFVHRVRLVTGRDSNPLNEIELICESLMDNDGVFRTGTVVKYLPDQSVTGLRAGDSIRLTVDVFARLSAAFFDELDRRFVSA